MGALFDSLKNHFENTPKDVLECEWNELKYLNDIGPDVIEYGAYVKEQFPMPLSYSSLVKRPDAHKFDVSEVSGGEAIPSDAPYYFAA